MLILFVVIILTGCMKDSNTFSCTMETEEDGIKIIEKIEAILDDNKVKSLNLIYDINDSEYANNMYDFYNTINESAIDESKVEISKNGNEITIKNAERILETDDIKYIGLTKEEFETIAKTTSENVTCK